jgi:hypothetical protein
MDKNSKILFILLFILTAAMTLVSLYKFVIFKNYQIEYEIDCDPEVEKCLIYECDLETEECSENPEEQIYYYQTVSEKASDIPLYE